MVDLTPTDGMVEEAQRGLDWREEYGRGGTDVGVARARDIVNRRELSPDTVGRMVSFFARHASSREAEGFKPGEDGYPSAGRIAWALWGGDPGQRWAEDKQSQLENAEKAAPLRTMILVATNAYVDDEDEIIRQVALESWVERSWEGDTFRPIPLKYFHRYDPIGVVIGAAMRGPFLIAAARELPDQPVRIGPSGERTTVSELWDAIEASPDEYGSSPGFYFGRFNPADRTFGDFYPHEISVLPLVAAANKLTTVNIVEVGHDANTTTAGAAEFGTR